MIQYDAENEMLVGLSSMSKDITGDKRAEWFIYYITLHRDTRAIRSYIQIFNGSTGGDKNTHHDLMWSSSYIMTDYAIVDLLDACGGISLADWVANYWHKGAPYSAELVTMPITSREIDWDDYQDGFIENSTLAKEDLAKLIDAQPMSYCLAFHGRMREEVYRLVFVKSANEFIQYAIDVH